MFIERALAGRLFSLQRSETKVGLPAKVGNIGAPLERELSDSEPYL
jgi:hypothetical protein